MSKYEDYDNKKDKDYDDEDYSKEEDDSEEFQISNILDYFKKNNIQVNGIFTYENVVRFLFIQYKNSGIDVFLYIPSKYIIKPDNSIKNYFNVNLTLEEQNEDEPPVVPSIFINSGASELLKKSIEQSLNRLVPLFSELNYKLVYIDREFLSYINRYNSVETFTFINPFNKEGAYFMIDLEKFYKVGSTIEKDLHNMETLLYTKVYNTFDNELPQLYDTLTQVSLEGKKFSGRESINKYLDRTKKVNQIFEKSKQNGRGVNDCLNVISNIRKDNFNKIIYMEKIIQLLKELKELNK